MTTMAIRSNTIARITAHDRLRCVARFMPVIEQHGDRLLAGGC
ncbi:hypothetical protein [Dactylosporangium sp. NPDC005555]